MWAEEFGIATRLRAFLKGFYWDNGKEHGSFYLGFRVKGLGLHDIGNCLRPYIP